MNTIEFDNPTDIQLAKAINEATSFSTERVLYSLIRLRMLSILFNPKLSSFNKKRCIDKLREFSNEKIYRSTYLDVRQGLNKLISNCWL